MHASKERIPPGAFRCHTRPGYPVNPAGGGIMRLFRHTTVVYAAAGLCALVAPGRPAQPAAGHPDMRSSAMTAVTIDVDKHPDRCFRIDSFSVPESARAEFEAAMLRNLKYLETLPGFMGHVVFEKADGPTSFNIVTLAAW